MRLRRCQPYRGTSCEIMFSYLFFISQTRGFKLLYSTTMVAVSIGVPILVLIKFAAQIQQPLSPMDLMLYAKIAIVIFYLLFQIPKINHFKKDFGF